MRFELDGRFFAQAPSPVAVRVVWLDQGAGSWVLQCEGKTALSMKSTGSGRWKETTVELKDARFTNLALRNTSDQDTLFHMIEVIRR